jgi:flavin reductase (DIM6/NTAB) family NADH-FMN oxidoreductase RutF
MQRHGAATRRFYAAFYQLTVRSANPTRPCVAGASLVSRRANSTTTGRSKRSPPFGPEPRILFPLKKIPKLSELLEDAVVHSTAERPFESLVAWDHAIREKSSSNIIVEIAVPAWVLHTLDLTRTAKINEVLVRLPDHKYGAGEFGLRSISLAGDPNDVRTVWKVLHDAGRRAPPRQLLQSFSESVRIPDEIPKPRPSPWRFTFNEGEAGLCEAYFCIPESGWRPLAENGCVEFFQQDFGVKTDDLGVYDTCTFLRMKGERFSLLSATRFLQQAHQWTHSQAQERYAFIRDFVNRGPDPTSGPLDALLSQGGRSETFMPLRAANGKSQNDATELPRSERRIRLRRFAVPEPLQRQFEDPDLLAKLKQEWSLEALRYRPMAGSKYYLQLLGTDAALEHAIPALENLLCQREDDGSGAPLDIGHLQIPENRFQPADATHFAWIKLPEAFDMNNLIIKMHRKLRFSDCTVQKFRAGGKEDLILRGTVEAIELATAGIQEQINERRAEHEKPAAKVDTYRMGLIQYISKMTPWEDSMEESPWRGEGRQELSNPAWEYPSQEETRFPSASDSKAAEPQVEPQFALGSVKWRNGAFVSTASDRGSSNPQVQPEAALKDVERKEAKPLWVTDRKAADPKVQHWEDLVGFMDESDGKAEDSQVQPKPAPKEVGQKEARVSSASDGKAADPRVQSESALQDVRQKETDVLPASASRVTNSRTEDAAVSKDNNDEAERRDPHQSGEQKGDYLRSALRGLTQPVALVTSIMPANSVKEKTSSGPRGVTVSSFCTVTLQPEPIISFNLRVPSRTWEAIKTSKALQVSLLTASPEGAAVAHAFTLPYERPYEPFERLESLGAFVSPSSRRRGQPHIVWDKAIYARVNASLLWKQCIRVGDHMIVFARVTHVRLEDSSTHANAGALAYGMRGYRSLGGEIKPMEDEAVAAKVEDVEPVKVELAKPNPVKESPTWKEGRAAAPKVGPAEPVETKPVETKPAKTKSAKKKSTKKESASVVRSGVSELLKEQSQKPLKDYNSYKKDVLEQLRKADAKSAERQGSSAPTDSTANEEEQAPKDMKDIGPSSPIMDEESLREALEESEASYSSKGLPSQTANENPMLAEALKAAAGAYDETPAAEAEPPITSTPSQTPDTTAESSSDATQNKTPSLHSQHVKDGPWGMNTNNTNNNKSSNRTFATWTRSQTRSYSTSNDSKSDTPDKILKSTVEDFLCQIPTNNRLYNNLIAAQRQAEKLEKLVAGGKVPAEEIDKVEHESQAIRRRVARELAWRNAQDLRVLLDQGHVNPERAQWLETNLEQGQAILLKEAKLLRAELEEGKLVKEDFEGSKAALMKDYEEFEGLLMRLREFVDEDDVGVPEGGQQQEAGSSTAGRP